VTSSLGPELKARRKAAGLTQEAVADQLGVARPTLTQWEGDRHRPKPEHLSKLDELYGARGELIKLAQSDQQGDDTPDPGRPLSWLTSSEMLRTHWSPAWSSTMTGDHSAGAGISATALPHRSAPPS